jgi:phospholipase C
MSQMDRKGEHQVRSQIPVGIAIASVALAMCTPRSRQPVEATTVGAPRTPIQHVVVILKENRSFDNYFGRFPGADGATTAVKSDGTTVQLAKTPDSLPNDINHSPASWKVAYDNGKMNGFDLETGAYSSKGQPLALSQMRQSEIPNYWAYASRYGLADHFFASWKGASFANNLYSIAAQAGIYDPTLGGRTVYFNPQSPTMPQLTYWGCDDPADTLVSMIDPTTGKLSSMFPCFNFPALPNTLASEGLSWHFYNTVGAQSVHDPLDALTPVRNSPALWSQVVPTNQFFSDASAGTLPAVSWIVGGQVEHAPQSSCLGENQSVGYVNAIMQNPTLWKSTVIFIVWDEWGGFYDHVAPPQVDGLSYGFRTPLIAISPYTLRGTSGDGGSISSTFYSNTSILKFIEDNWSLPSLTPADARANDMMDMFDFSSSATLKQPLVLQPRACPPLTPAQKLLVKSENPD